MILLQESSPRLLKLSITRDGGRYDDVLVNITLSYSDDGVQALPGYYCIHLPLINFTDYGFYCLFFRTVCKIKKFNETFECG